MRLTPGVLVIVLLLMLVSAGPANAGDEHWVGLNTVSKHISPGRDYNEANWGVFYERRTSEDWGWQAGYYKNSFERDTFYGLGIWQPLHLGPVDLGGFLGAGTGYLEEKDGRGEDRPKNGLSALAGFLITFKPVEDVGLNLIVASSVVALQLKWRFQ